MRRIAFLSIAALCVSYPTQASIDIVCELVEPIEAHHFLVDEAGLDAIGGGRYKAIDGQVLDLSWVDDVCISKYGDDRQLRLISTDGEAVDVDVVEGSKETIDARMLAEVTDAFVVKRPIRTGDTTMIILFRPVRYPGQ